MHRESCLFPSDLAEHLLLKSKLIIGLPSTSRCHIHTTIYIYMMLYNLDLLSCIYTYIVQYTYRLICTMYMYIYIQQLHTYNVEMIKTLDFLQFLWHF